MKSDMATSSSSSSRAAGAGSGSSSQQGSERPPFKPLVSAARDYNDDAGCHREPRASRAGGTGSHFRPLANGLMVAWLGLALVVQSAGPVWGAGLTLDFSPKESRNVEVAKYDPAPRLMEVLAADVEAEFAETSSILMHLKEALEQYGHREQLKAISEEMKVHMVSANLARLGVNIVDEPQTQRIASELDFMMATFWGEFLPLIQRIVTEKPQELHPGIDLAFRCARRNELSTLYNLSTHSTLYSLIWQVFTSELYVHCIRRKLSTLELTQVRPSSAVKQFVDIYTGFPVHYSVLLSQPNLSSEERIQAGKYLAASGLQFDLQRALASHGPLQAAASLVFDTETSPLALGSADMIESSQRLVNRFRSECQELLERLEAVWGDMDQVAGSLSSPMNDLREFASRIKLATPQLIYGSVCSQLIQTIKS